MGQKPILWYNYYRFYSISPTLLQLREIQPRAHSAQRYERFDRQQVRQLVLKCCGQTWHEIQNSQQENFIRRDTSQQKNTENMRTCSGHQLRTQQKTRSKQKKDIYPSAK